MSAKVGIIASAVALVILTSATALVWPWLEENTTLPDLLTSVFDGPNSTTTAKSPEPEPEPAARSLESIPDLLDLDEDVVFAADTAVSMCLIFVQWEHNAYYCTDNDTIYIGTWVKDQPFGVQIFVHAHEDGHSEDPNLGQVPAFESEQFADQYAGSQMARLLAEDEITQSDIDDVITWMHTLSAVPNDHGTYPQRIEAFRRGLSTPV